MDRSRFEIELLPCYKRIYAICLTIVRDRDEASDAVQETYARLWAHRNNLDNVGSVEAYAIKIAKRICIDKLRSREVVSTDKSGSSDEAAVDDRVEHADELRLVNALLEQLPPNQRNVVD